MIADGKLDHHVAMTGPDLVQFVDGRLCPYLASFKQKAAETPKSIQYKIGEIFSELKNRIQSGYNLREILEYIDELEFRTQKDKHELSHLYESCETSVSFSYGSFAHGTMASDFGVSSVER
jgi:type I restriction enzyme M protein